MWRRLLGRQLSSYSNCFVKYTENICYNVDYDDYTQEVLLLLLLLVLIRLVLVNIIFYANLSIYS